MITPALTFMRADNLLNPSSKGQRSQQIADHNLPTDYPHHSPGFLAVAFAFSPELRRILGARGQKRKEVTRAEAAVTQSGGGPFGLGKCAP